MPANGKVGEGVSGAVASCRHLECMEPLSLVRALVGVESLRMEVADAIAPSHVCGRGVFEK